MIWLSALVFAAALAGTSTMALWQSTNHSAWRRRLGLSSTTALLRPARTESPRRPVEADPFCA